MASTQNEAETQTQIDSITKTDQVPPRPIDPTTVSRPSIASMLGKRAPILSTTEPSHRATTYLRPTQFNSSMTMIQT